MKNQKQKEDEDELNRLRKLIKTNIVGSNKFYKFN